MAHEILLVQWPQGVHLQAFADVFAFIATDNIREGIRKLSKFAQDKFKNMVEKINCTSKWKNQAISSSASLSEDQRLNLRTNQLAVKTILNI
ncbi:hypothetical protein AVEN_26237-1 [Araneus ventricosus]|uniref:Uncharacterized protein n=1 Tax=Araneus ventricosus TaxID=182803 RepID=A0A4Y2ALS4_ARAVE|nr:hypothetical protein AVEN_26237-1 [Araneus ventricosus]